jgi:hypothetical protein
VGRKDLAQQRNDPDDEHDAPPPREFTDNLRKITPQNHDPEEFAREFLDRYVANNRRVVGVRFGPTTIDVQVSDRDDMNELPTAFHGVLVVLHDWPPQDPPE